MSICRTIVRQTKIVHLRSILLQSRRHFTECKNENLPLLDRQHHQLIQRIQNLLNHVQSEFPILSTSDKKLLQEAQQRMNSIFLLVVVGEFNSGKSQFINTLLDEKEEICLTGVLPTTDVIQILKYGPYRKDVVDSEHIKSIYLPNQWLRDTNIVDTPGTNAILQTHQQITEHFIPQSDYILFVTSVDRPFSESERLFLTRIHQWRKKVLIILNKIDQIRNETDKQKILDYVQHNSRQVFDDSSVPIFLISALRSIGIQELKTYLRTELNDNTKLKLKLENPLGITERLFDHYSDIVEKRTEILREDEQVLHGLQGIIEDYRRQLTEDFQFQMNKIDNVFFRMMDNLEEFLLEYIQISKLIPTLLNWNSSADLKIQFNNRVNKNIEEDINHAISQLCDWLLERSNRAVEQLQKHLHSSSINRQKYLQEKETKTNLSTDIDVDFTISRQQILKQLQTQSQNILYVQKTATGSQADEISSSIRGTMLGTAAIEIGAVGFGAIAALASFDWTGLLGASLIGLMGLYFIPMRRSEIKKEMKERIDKTRSDLIDQLNKHFSVELDSNERKMRDVIMPYVQFVQNEQAKLKQTTEQIETIRHEIRQLRVDVRTSLTQHRNIV